MVLLASFFFALPGIAGESQRSDYPNRPIRLIVPFGPGGGSDYVGRLVGQKLSEQMRQTVVVDNRPGAASLVGTEIVA
jgi:tripartite-type tricarboxylate transporter receptor subunit TctC